MPAVYVVKAVQHGLPIPGVFEELGFGRARIGWSYQDKLDLRLIRDKISQGQSLDGDEQDAKRCLGFLSRPKRNDYLIYPHQPQRNWFSVVNVTGEYDYSTEKDGIVTRAGSDFRSFRPCSLVTPEPIHMQDEIVPSQLRHRLGRPGRFSEIYDTRSFFTFLKDLSDAGHRQDGSNRAKWRRIHTALRKELPDLLYMEFNRADLSRRFCSELFERMGYTANIQEGPGEAGSDIVATVGDLLLPDEVEFRIGVQVFSSTGPVEESYLLSKLKQLVQGWEDNSLNYGVLLTTGRCTDAAKAALLKHNQNEQHSQNGQKKLVRLIDGDELADLVLKHFLPGTD